MFKKAGKILRFFMFICLAGLMVTGFSTNAQAASVKTMFGKKLLISHAAGGINNTNYTNSKTAFLTSLNNGYKVIEMDFAFSKDGKLICTHSAKLAKQYTKAQWKKYKINNLYASMCATDVIKYMALNPKIYIVCDMKMSNVQKGYAALFNEAYKKGGKALVNRIVPQIYSQDELDLINTIYKWPTVIFTMYRLGNFNYKTIAKYIKLHPQIKIMTIPEAKLTKAGIAKVHKYCSAKVFTHTINTMEKIKQYQLIGVDGFYTDYITPAMYK